MAVLPVTAAAGLAAPPAAPAPSFGAALRAHLPRPPDATASATSAAPARAVLGRLEHARERLDAVLAAARGGRTFTPQELLALQADAYRYAQTVEVASKVAEQGAQAVKQAVNTQV